MGGLISWLRAYGADPWAYNPPGSAHAISEILTECWAPVGMPSDVVALIMSFYCFEGKLASTKSVSEEIKFIVTLSSVFVTSTGESLTCWKGLRRICTRKVAHQCVAHLDEIIWCGGRDGSLMLFDAGDMQLLRLVRGHKVPVGALVVSSNAKRVFSYPTLAGDFIRVWNPRGLPIHTLRDPAVNFIHAPHLRLVVSPDESHLSLWDGPDRVWHGPAHNLQSRPSQVSSFTISNSSNPMFEEGATVIAPRAPQLDNCGFTISTYAHKVHLCDEAGRPTRPIWDLPTNTSVYAAGVFRNRVLLSTSDHVMYVYE